MAITYSWIKNKFYLVLSDISVLVEILNSSGPFLKSFVLQDEAILDFQWNRTYKLTRSPRGLKSLTWETRLTCSFIQNYVLLIGAEPFMTPGTLFTKTRIYLSQVTLHTKYQCIWAIGLWEEYFSDTQNFHFAHTFIPIP